VNPHYNVTYVSGHAYVAQCPYIHYESGCVWNATFSVPSIYKEDCYNARQISGD